MTKLKKPLFIDKNQKNDLKSSNDGKIGLVGADTKFDLITRVFSSGSQASYNLNTIYPALNEAANIEFIFTTTGPDSTFYWTNTGTTNASDFVENSTSGSFATTGGSGSVTLTLIEDKFTEGSETIEYHVRIGSISGSIVASSPILVINDTSIGEYFISSSANTVNEGVQLTFNITTTAPDGELFWTGAGTTTGSDFIENINSGSLFTTSGTGSLVLNVKNDILTEGLETFILQVRTNNFDGNVVAVKSITINDTSTTQYAVSASALNVIEGSPVTFTFTTTGPDGTFGWYLDPVTFPNPGGGMGTHPYPVASDFNENITSGSFITTNGTGSITLNVTKDLYTEPVERFRFVVTNGGDLVSTNIVYIYDYYKLVPSVENVNEGSAVTFTFNTEGPDETFYWSNDGTTNSDDFIEGLNSGSFATVSGTGSIVFTLKNDVLTENTENIRLLVRSGSSGGTLIAVSSYVYVEDTSPNQYTITASSNPVSEGSPITFTFTTTGPDETFNWQNIGTSNAADFVENINSGSFITINGTGSLTLNVKEDNLTEGSETIRINVRNTLNQLLVQSSIIDITDTSLSQYLVNRSTANVNEGSSVTFTVTTTDPDGTFYWTNGGTTDASDFVSNVNSGSFAVTSGTGSVVLTLKEDLLTEGAETIIFQLRSGSIGGDVVASSSVVTVNDTSTNSYNVAASSLYVNEGSPITFTFTTTGPDGTFDWYLDPVTFSSGGGISTYPFPIASDFVENTTSGSFVTTNGTGSVTLNVVIDAITEPPERFVFAVDGAASSPVVFISNRYGLYSSANDVNEGSSVTFTFITQDPDNTFYWTNTGTSTASDFVENVTSGSFVTTNGTGSLVLTTVEDLTTEGLETIDLQIRSGSYSGTILASITVDINDTSEYQYSMTPNSLLIGEADSVTFTFTTNVADGTFYWENVGTTDADDFIENITSGSFITVNGTGSMQLNLLEDNIAEEQETIIIGVRGTETGSVLVYSPTVLVNNTSGDEVIISGSGPTPNTFKLATSALSVYEGSPVTFTLTTNAPDQTFYWSLISPSGDGVLAADADDFVEGLNSGSFVTVANTGSFTLTTKDDLHVENTVEKFRVRIRSGSFAGTIVGQSPNISIYDNYSYSLNIISGSYDSETSTIEENTSFSVSLFSNITNGTYYWENVGTAIGSDFVNGQNSGSFTMTNGTGSISLSMKQDLLTEGTETIVLQIMSGALKQTKAIIPIIYVSDTSLTQYSITPSSTSINEGSSVTFTFTTTGPDETFYWSNIGTTVASDFISNVNTGSFVTVAGTGSIALSLKNDLLTEGTETIVLSVRSGSAVGTIVSTSDTVSVNDTSLTQYSLTTNNASVTEGNNITFTFTTTGPDETFYWTNGGTTTASDFASNANSGSFATTAGTGSITLTLQEDSLEENETIILQARSGSFGGPIVATSFLINVINASYALSASSLSVNEGSSVTFTFTTNVPDKTFYWTNSGTSVAADFTDAQNSGSFVTVAGTGSIVRTLASDLTTEGDETIIMNVRNNDYGGNIVASSSIVTINDTSIWTPDLLNLKYAYYKADTGVTTSGTSVTAWADQSGLSNTLTPGSSPTYVANGAPNGKPAITFANNQLQNTNLQGIDLSISGSSDMTIIYIGKMDTWQADRGMVRFDINANSFSRSLTLRTGPNNNWGGDANSNQGLGINGTRSYVNGLATTPAVRVIKRVNSEGVYVYENGTLVSQALASLSSYTNVTKRLFLGTNVNVGTRAATTAYEVIVLGYAISDADIAKLQTYAQNYWGI